MRERARDKEMARINVLCKHCVSIIKNNSLKSEAFIRNGAVGIRGSARDKVFVRQLKK